jgi:heptaprenyl diphosphate synthase
MRSQDSYRIAVLSAFALALHAAETMLPSPVPWIKPGFSNIIALVALYLFGFKTALYVTLIRVTAGSMLLGTFPGPAFVLSMAGGLASIASMALILSTMPKLFSPLGISVIGALFHNSAQLITAYAIFIHRIEPVIIAAPLLLLIGTATGLLNGLLCRYLISRIKQS